MTNFRWPLRGLTAALALMTALPASADFKVRLPDVNEGLAEAEFVGDAGFDSKPDKDGEQAFVGEFSYGVNNWWKTELEVETGTDPGLDGRLRWDAVTWENIFKFTERGEYWIDVGLFAEYSHGLSADSTDEITAGPILRKDFWGLSNTINAFLTKQIGTHAAGRLEFEYAWETRFEDLTAHLGRYVLLQPGFQYYGVPGQIGHFDTWQEQDQRIGPQIFGKILGIAGGTLEFNAGLLFGLTAATPEVTPRWQLEFEIPL